MKHLVLPITNFFGETLTTTPPKIEVICFQIVLHSCFIHFQFNEFTLHNMNIQGFTLTLLVLNTYNDVGGLYTLIVECKSYTILTHNTPFLGGNATFMLTKKQKRTEKNQAPSPGKTLFLVVNQSGVCKRHLKGTAYMNTRRQEWSFQLNH